MFYHVGHFSAPVLSGSPLHLTLPDKLLPEKEIHNPSRQKISSEWLI